MSKATTTVKAGLHPSSGPTTGRPKGKNTASATNPPALRPAAKTRQKMSMGTTGNRTSVDARGVHLNAANGKLVATMKTKAKTLRLEPEYENALGFLKAVLGASVNKMVNDAVG
ncbi:MAG: hypothetical protein ACXWKQ_13880, partial [Reyranella sp.]